MRIGLFTDTYTPDINGVVSSVVTLQNALEKLGHEVFIITNHSQLEVKQVGNVLFLPGIELKKLYGYTLSSVYSIKGKVFVENMNLDIIHVHTEFGVGIYGRILSKLLRIPLVSTYHTAYEDYTHYINIFDKKIVEKYAKIFVAKITKLYTNTTKAVIAPSLKTKQMLQQYGVTTPIYVIPTGLNLEKFNVRDKIKTQIIQSNYHLQNKNVMLFVGRIAEEKNIVMLLEAMQYIDDVVLFIVGDGPQLPQLKQSVIDLALNDKVIFAGKKDRDEIAHYYHACDVFVSASTSETQGMTYIEAMACGKVVFARRDEVVQKLVKELHNGYLFDNAKELAEKIKQYFALSFETKEQLKQNAIDTTKEFDDITFGKQVSLMYEEVLQKSITIDEVRFEKDGVRLFTGKESIMVDMDAYLKYYLAKGKQISKQLYDTLRKSFEIDQAYQSVLKKLQRKWYTEKEVRKLLSDVGIEEVDTYIQRLKENRLINDEEYKESYLTQSKLQYYSNRQIMDKLVEKGIDEFIERDEKKVALQYAQKLARTQGNISSIALKNKIRQKLYTSQFMLDSIHYAMENVVIEIDEEKEKAVYEKTLLKAQRLYEKYDGYEKTRRIKLYLLSKGLKYNED